MNESFLNDSNNLCSITNKNVSKKKIKNNKLMKVKSYGPVSNLEEYVQPDWWKIIFNSLYLKTDGDVVEDQTITKKEIDLFVKILNCDKNSRILDLCCGQGRHSLELARRGYINMEGLDSSHYLIQKAKTQAKKEYLSVKFKEGGARKLPYSTDYFDCIMILGNSFGYFETIKDDLTVLKEVYRVLKPGGKLLIDVADGDYLKSNFQPRSWEWIDKKYFVCRERKLSLDKQKLISREVVTHVDKGVLADQFYAERLYTNQSIKELLEISKFNQVCLHSEIVTETRRNQDLGMMERRILITASVQKEWSVQKKNKKEKIRNVAVLLGDPDKSDIIKPSTVFDEDDIYTVNQLKDALYHLKGFKFFYFNNHNTLINDLLKQKQKLDYIFNLCDEGYNNDAKKELHVPALLEVVDIPYTGSGPQCLAFCYDKSLVRGIAKEMEIPVPEALYIKPEDVTLELSFDLPVIVKPNYGDSSFGITKRSVANNAEELVDAVTEIREKLGYDKSLIVEELLTGSDISVGIIGNPPENYKILPIIEEDYSALPEGLPKICGYEAKWLQDSPYWNSIKSIPAQLSEEKEKFIIECCLKLFERLECRDYCRFDWRLDVQGNPKLLEVNPNPGWCWDGHLAKMAKYQGLDYSAMLSEILKAAEERLKI